MTPKLKDGLLVFMAVLLAALGIVFWLFIDGYVAPDAVAVNGAAPVIINEAAANAPPAIPASEKGAGFLSAAGGEDGRIGKYDGIGDTTETAANGDADTAEVTDTAESTDTTTATDTDEVTTPTETTAYVGTSEQTVYILNTSTKKFHLPSCSSVASMKDKNKAWATERGEIIADGYEPCKKCKP